MYKQQGIQAGVLAVVASFSGLAGAAGIDIDLPQVYGRADVSIHSSTVGDEDRVISTESNASRFGLQNTHRLQENVYVFYRLEYEVNFDERLRSSERNFLRARNSYVGLRNSLGEIFVGIHDTPLKVAEQKVDLFSDAYLADIDNVLAGQDRVSDTINLRVKVPGNVSLWAMLIPGEGEDPEAGSDAAQGDSTDALSFSASGEIAGVSLVLAYNSDLNSAEILRLSAQGKVGPVQLGALVQQGEAVGAESDSGLAYVLSAAYKLGEKNVIKLQYTAAENDMLADVSRDQNGDGLPDVDEAQLFTLGLDHKLAKSTKVYTYYSQRVVDGAEAEEYDTFGVGLRHEFGNKK